ncbi:methionyl-tRNA formyltransferase [Coxiella endosymbiont of Amblyomma nuttalli]|uniref:methionyl-tRNA formyltransferase n=1 Tax=Coxiella endosymbiont of Amblyomma nuttalli TaxID=2749996 RepID=UPI001BA94B6B|nr:methionyl-tRNA formyltransferase [Coxiella endosymbiont of Amblyomma nuttalli]QTS83591.1 Methionyl-tRNA formyltransferase [Coxiella endosymbiont of Amblyomma nuttalli]
MSLTIIFAGTPAFSVPILETLLRSSHQVVAVYTQPDRPTGRGRKVSQSPVKIIAKKHGILVRQPASLQESTAQQELMAMKSDVMVVVAYGLLLPKIILTNPKLGCLNVHASLLPRWRGAAPIQQAILTGDCKTGVSIIQMNEELDTGDVLAKRSCMIQAKDTSANLYNRLSQLGADLLTEILDKLEEASVTAEKQDSNRAIYAPKIRKKQAELDWRKSADELARYVRAFNPTPVAFTYFNGQPIRIWEAEALDVFDEKTVLEPGTLAHADKNGLDIVTGKGILRVYKLQLPGKRIHSANDFINAHQGELISGKAIFKAFYPTI